MNPIREHLLALLTEKFDAAGAEVDDASTLEDLDLDSLARVELVVTLQEHWGVALDDDTDSAAEVTVGRLVERVQELLGRPAPVE
ncbi:acyl carrier protein [Streptomyces tateyamensis]|uniref:acyl carrier protein n=1 Tax=Streptomyces tateyamensis TaxID=565073 RepID=UPI0015E8A012|nr:acyl carrier protein [Streptomyces tateyamensis]